MKILSIEVDEAEIIPYLGLIFGMKTWSEGSKTIYHLKANNVSFRMVYGFATFRFLYLRQKYTFLTMNKIFEIVQIFR